MYIHICIYICVYIYIPYWLFPTMSPNWLLPATSKITEAYRNGMLLASWSAPGPSSHAIRTRRARIHFWHHLLQTNVGHTNVTSYGKQGISKQTYHFVFLEFWANLIYLVGFGPILRTDRISFLRFRQWLNFVS